MSGLRLLLRLVPRLRIKLTFRFRLKLMPRPKVGLILVFRPG